MDFSLTEEQELLLASIRELITTNFPEEHPHLRSKRDISA